MRILMRIVIILLLITFLPLGISYAGGPALGLSETDSAGFQLFAAFDLRDRESFVQVTNQFGDNATIHVQIYDVSNLCNENDFFDVYTPSDTHVYNLRNIITNDGNPSGVILPENSYGIVYISFVQNVPLMFGNPFPIFGNLRILDNNGYEYRTNMQSLPEIGSQLEDDPLLIFNYNNENGVVLSDVFGIPISIEELIFSSEATIDDVLNTFFAVDVDIVNNNEVIFSCRDVIFACIDENSPLLEELIANAGQAVRTSASVARFEYGINDVIPHSKGGELLCPGNNIPEGVVILTLENIGDRTFQIAGYVGLNNGNGRGSMDSFFTNSIIEPEMNGMSE